MSDIGDAVERASRYLTDHPDEARYRDAPAKARLEKGLHVEVSGSSGERLATDMPQGIGGSATNPSPGWFYRAAVASCVASLIAIRAAAQGLDLAPGAVEVTVDSESDDRGILGLDDAIAAGALSVRIVIRIDVPRLDRATREALAAWAIDHCPVSDTARRAVPIQVELL